MTRSQTRGRGPISSLPTELLLAILKILLARCSAILDRQRASQRFLRVNRAFHSAYLLSPSAHECAVTSTAQAASLGAQLERSDTRVGPVRELWIGLRGEEWSSDDRIDLAVADLVRAAAGELRSFVWETDEECGWDIADDLARAWEGCVKVQRFVIAGDDDNWRGIVAAQFQR